MTSAHHLTAVATTVRRKSRFGRAPLPRSSRAATAGRAGFTGGLPRSTISRTAWSSVAPFHAVRLSRSAAPARSTSRSTISHRAASRPRGGKPGRAHRRALPRLRTATSFSRCPPALSGALCGSRWRASGRAPQVPLLCGHADGEASDLLDPDGLPWREARRSGVPVRMTSPGPESVTAAEPFDERADVEIRRRTSARTA